MAAPAHPDLHIRRRLPVLFQNGSGSPPGLSKLAAFLANSLDNLIPIIPVPLLLNELARQAKDE
jgi:hypothetical protein